MTQVICEGGDRSVVIIACRDVLFYFIDVFFVRNCFVRTFFVKAVYALVFDLSGSIDLTYEDFVCYGCDDEATGGAFTVVRRLYEYYRFVECCMTD